MWNLRSNPRGEGSPAQAGPSGRMRNLTTRLVIVLMLTLMVITGVYDYVRLVRERERLVEQTQEDERIFAETLALAVSRNVRWGRTTAELKELLGDILARPGLVAVAIYDPEGQVVTENAFAVKFYGGRQVCLVE